MLFVNNLADLLEDIERYKQQFPGSYTTYSEIRKTLVKRKDDPMGSTFGISVAGEWQDKCYGFEVDKVNATQTYFQYLGTWKT